MKLWSHFRTAVERFCPASFSTRSTCCVWTCVASSRFCRKSFERLRCRCSTQCLSTGASQNPQWILSESFEVFVDSNALGLQAFRFLVLINYDFLFLNIASTEWLRDFLCFLYFSLQWFLVFQVRRDSFAVRPAQVFHSPAALLRLSSASLQAVKNKPYAVSQLYWQVYCCIL